MKKLILLSLVLLPLMGSLYGPPPAPGMPGKDWAKERAKDWKNRATPSPASSSTPSPAPSPTPSPSGEEEKLPDGTALRKAYLKKLPIGTQITVNRDGKLQVLEVFEPGRVSPLPEDYYNVTGSLLKVTMIESGSNGFSLDNDKPMLEMNFSLWIKKQPEVNGVIGFVSGQPSAGPKPSVPLSPEQKLIQNLASLEVSLKTLNKNI